MGDFLIVKSAVKQYATVKGKPLNLGSDAADKLHEICVELIKKGAERAASNGRSTLRAQDL